MGCNVELRLKGYSWLKNKYVEKEGVLTKLEEVNRKNLGYLSMICKIVMQMM